MLELTFRMKNKTWKQRIFASPASQHLHVLYHLESLITGYDLPIMAFVFSTTESQINEIDDGLLSLKWCIKGECVDDGSPMIDGGWSDWQDTQSCTRTCGGGVQWKTRTCTNPV